MNQLSTNLYRYEILLGHKSDPHKRPLLEVIKLAGQIAQGTNVRYYHAPGPKMH